MWNNIKLISNMKAILSLSPLNWNFQECGMYEVFKLYVLRLQVGSTLDRTETSFPSN